MVAGTGSLAVVPGSPARGVHTGLPVAPSSAWTERSAVTTTTVPSAISAIDPAMREPAGNDHRSAPVRPSSACTSMSSVGTYTVPSLPTTARHSSVHVSCVRGRWNVHSTRPGSGPGSGVRKVWSAFSP